QERREIFIQDQRGALQLAQRVGREEGDYLASQRIAINLLHVLDDESIANNTGLSLDDVRALRQQDKGV
ncbi:MAG: hypothetical protein Q9M09_00305, partial [Mariprofundaceae bacterium]|nr:hypothetical protein [Mariprofundaceae bacterium]